MNQTPTPIQIRVDDIIPKFTKKSFERGEHYYDLGMVERVIRRGGRLFAEVRGSGWDDLYAIAIALNGRDFSASCACPYDWGGYCKHIAATMLAFINGGDDFEVGEPVEDALARLDADELRALAIRMIESHPDLADILDAFASASRPRENGDDKSIIP